MSSSFDSRLQLRAPFIINTNYGLSLERWVRVGVVFASAVNSAWEIPGPKGVRPCTAVENAHSDEAERSPAPAHELPRALAVHRRQPRLLRHNLRRALGRGAQRKVARARVRTSHEDDAVAVEEGGGAHARPRVRRVELAQGSAARDAGGEGALERALDRRERTVRRPRARVVAPAGRNVHVAIQERHPRMRPRVDATVV
mmetsp:Transcript_17670/g.57786  ORF Transcript_17670/g.57786 Transcript_17670/m.57786 type:complete len:200 (-) Transcript_17670:1103-1702(-)